MSSKKANVEKRLEELRKQIREHDYYYYVLDRPKISDYEYDQLFLELQKLEKEHPELVTPDSPTQRVPGAPLEVFEKDSHRKPMLSLANTYSVDEIREFDDRVKKFLGNNREITYFCEPKF